MEEQLLTIDEVIVTIEDTVDEWDNHIGDNVSF
jgi:hypothetical protein